MMNALIALGMGIVIFALIVGVGVVILTNFGNAVAQCATAYTFNTTQQKCVNATNGNPTAPTNSAFSSTSTMQGYLTSNLITWIPAIIALGVGLLFIGSLMGKKQQSY